MQQPFSPAPPPAPRQPSGAFERLMQSITAMSALAILFVMLFPLLLCVGIGAFCVLTGVVAGHVPTPTPLP